MENTSSVLNVSREKRNDFILKVKKGMKERREERMCCPLRKRSGMETDKSMNLYIVVS